MQLQETIKKAVAVVGSQRELARLIGEREQHISDFKRGRPCSYQKHAQIAAVAGLHEDATRILLEGMAESLRDDVEHEAKAKAGIAAMLAAFPQTLLDGLRRSCQIRPQDWGQHWAIGPFFASGHCPID